MPLCEGGGGLGGLGGPGGRRSLSGAKSSPRAGKSIIAKSVVSRQQKVQKDVSPSQPESAKSQTKPQEAKPESKKEVANDPV